MYILIRKNRTIHLRKIWYQSTVFNEKTYYIERFGFLSKKIKEVDNQDVILKTDSYFIALRVKKYFDTTYHREFSNQRVVKLIALLLSGKLE